MDWPINSSITSSFGSLSSKFFIKILTEYKEILKIIIKKIKIMLGSIFIIWNKNFFHWIQGRSIRSENFWKFRKRFYTWGASWSFRRGWNSIWDASYN